MLLFISVQTYYMQSKINNSLLWLVLYHVAKYLGLRTPIAYKWRRFALPRQVVNKGINFAFGGAGVYETIFTVPTASMQINSFERLLRKNVYSPADLNSSVAFFSFIGNDYIKYNIFNGTSQVYKLIMMLL